MIPDEEFVPSELGELGAEIDPPKTPELQLFRIVSESLNWRALLKESEIWWKENPNQLNLYKPLTYTQKCICYICGMMILKTLTHA